MPRPPNALRELQRCFFQAISRCQPVARSVAEAQPGILAPERWILADDRATALARLEVYAEMYLARLCSVLQEDYPTLVALLGEPRFVRLVRDYLVAHPSRQGSVRHVGHQLPSCLRKHAYADRWPWLADLAELELARSHAIDAADATPLTAGQLATVPAEQWAGLRLSLVPAHRLLELRYPVHRLWHAVHETAETAGAQPDQPPTLAPQPTWIVVWRHALCVYHRTLSSRDYSALLSIARAAPFARVCERIAADAAGDQAATYLARKLRQWVDDGLVCRPATWST